MCGRTLSKVTAVEIVAWICTDSSTVPKVGGSLISFPTAIHLSRDKACDFLLGVRK